MLGFLVDEPIEAIALGPNHVVPVRVPASERFVFHKLISSKERKTDRAKSRKDLEQAAAIAAALNAALSASGRFLCLGLTGLGPFVGQARRPRRSRTIGKDSPSGAPNPGDLARRR